MNNEERQMSVMTRVRELIGRDIYTLDQLTPEEALKVGQDAVCWDLVKRGAK